MLFLLFSLLLVEPTWADDVSPPADVHSLIESLHSISGYSPAENDGVLRHEIEIHRFDRLPWEAVSVADLRSKAYTIVPNASYAISVAVNCHEAGIKEDGLSRGRFLWYVFRKGKLISYDHFRIEVDDERKCAVQAKFQRAQDTLHDIDPLLNYREAYHGVSLGIGCGGAEAYARGVAYATRGRLVEASALLAEGDRWVRLDDAHRVRSAPGGPACRAPTERARTQLVNRLPAPSSENRALPFLP